MAGDSFNRYRGGKDLPDKFPDRFEGGKDPSDKFPDRYKGGNEPRIDPADDFVDRVGYPDIYTNRFLNEKGNLEKSINRFEGENAYLSNMFPLEVGIKTPDGIVVGSAEQLYLPARLVMPEARMVVMMAKDGKSAKKLLGSLERSGSPVREDWDDSTKISVMRAAVLAKFILNPELAERLLNTGDTEIIEGNNWNDRFWGVSPPPPNPNAQGRNWLGKILMETRDTLRDPHHEVDVESLVAETFPNPNRIK